MDKVFHYLHEQAIGTTKIQRIDSQRISFMLSGEDSVRELIVDERDRRAFVVFDGEILCGALPKSATVVHRECIGELLCPMDHLRVTPDYCLNTRPKYGIKNKMVFVRLTRNFVLLPSCTTVVQKYRNKSLSPLYVVIHVFSSQKDNRVVEWETTSF